MSRTQHSLPPVSRQPNRAHFTSRAPLLEKRFENAEKARIAAANTLISGKFYFFLKSRHELTGMLADVLASIYGSYFGKGYLSYDNLFGQQFRSHAVRSPHTCSRIIYEVTLSRANTDASLLLDITNPSRPAFVFIGTPPDAALFLAQASEREIENASEKGYREAFAKTK